MLVCYVSGAHYVYCRLSQRGDRRSGSHSPLLLTMKMMSVWIRTMDSRPATKLELGGENARLRRRLELAAKKFDEFMPLLGTLLEDPWRAKAAMLQATLDAKIKLEIDIATDAQARGERQMQQRCIEVADMISFNSVADDKISIACAMIAREISELLPLERTRIFGAVRK
jgi:hypothetical protein